MWFKKFEFTITILLLTLILVSCSNDNTIEDYNNVKSICNTFNVSKPCDYESCVMNNTLNMSDNIKRLGYIEYEQCMILYNKR